MNTPASYCFQDESLMICLQFYVKPNYESLGSKVSFMYNPQLYFSNYYTTISDLILIYQAWYFMALGRRGKAEEIKFTVDYRHSTWNHICWSLDGKIKEAAFFFNGNFIGKIKIKEEYTVHGFPEFENFLLFGQEPDYFKGGFDKQQALQGKISRFNWWSYVLQENVIYNFAHCNQIEEGDIVSWRKSLFSIESNLVETVEPKVFCDPPDKWIFFPGQRKHSEAENLCAAHGGWIVVPTSPDENQMVQDLYRDNSKDCKGRC